MFFLLNAVYLLLHTGRKYLLLSLQEVLQFVSCVNVQGLSLELTLTQYQIRCSCFKNMFIDVVIAHDHVVSIGVAN